MDERTSLLVRPPDQNVPPEVGMLDAKSPRASPFIVMKMVAANHPQTIATGPPLGRAYMSVVAMEGPTPQMLNAMPKTCNGRKFHGYD